jgi:hypothetical protein
MNMGFNLRGQAEDRGWSAVAAQDDGKHYDFDRMHADADRIHSDLVILRAALLQTWRRKPDTIFQPDEYRIIEADDKALWKIADERTPMANYEVTEGEWLKIQDAKWKKPG